MPMVTLADTRCADCGCIFGVPGDFLNNRRKDKRSFYCPNGHGMSYTESETDILRRERDRLKQQIAQKDDEILEAKRVASARLGANTKLRKRIGNGVCPCCTRSFSNIAAHMRTKHPDFKKPLEVVNA